MSPEKVIWELQGCTTVISSKWHAGGHRNGYPATPTKDVKLPPTCVGENGSQLEINESRTDIQDDFHPHFVDDYWSLNYFERNTRLCAH